MICPVSLGTSEELSLEVVVSGCDEIIYRRGDGGSALFSTYGLLYNKVVKLKVLRSVLSGVLLGLDVI